MFGFGKTTAKNADLIVQLWSNGKYRILKDSRTDIRPYDFVCEGINACLFLKVDDVETMGGSWR